MKTTHKSTILGLILLLLFFVQFFLKIEWHWLLDLQQEQLYRRWSGLGLAIFIIFQWFLTFIRIIKKLRKHAIKMQFIHKWIGAVSPILFYIHSINLGYGYLLLLSYIFFTNTLLGYLNLDVIKNKSMLLFKGWMISHVAFSIIVTIMMLLHITIVFYYK